MTTPVFDALAKGQCPQCGALLKKPPAGATLHPPRLESCSCGYSFHRPIGA